METISKKKWQKVAKQARGGEAAMQFELGYYTLNGASTKSGEVLCRPNKRRAMRWYLLAAENGDSYAKLALSDILSEGNRPDFRAAIQWAKSAIEQSNSLAAYNLGIIYRDLGKPKLAFHYYLLAEKLGDIEACLQIGLCHLLGHGTPLNHAAAAASFRKIVEAQSSAVTQRARENALYWLSLLNLMGLRSSRRLGQARRMLKLANADMDHEHANDLLNVIGKSPHSIRSRK